MDRPDDSGLGRDGADPSPHRRHRGLAAAGWGRKWLAGVTAGLTAPRMGRSRGTPRRRSLGDPDPGCARSTRCGIAATDCRRAIAELQCDSCRLARSGPECGLPRPLSSIIRSAAPKDLRRVVPEAPVLSSQVPPRPRIWTNAIAGRDHSRRGLRFRRPRAGNLTSFPAPGLGAPGAAGCASGSCTLRRKAPRGVQAEHPGQKHRS